MQMNKQFKEWLLVYLLEHHDYMQVSDFNELPFPMQWGVYLEFFDSVGIVIEIKPHYKLKNFDLWMSNGDMLVKVQRYDTRQEAQQEAIKKAFSILEKI